MDSPASIQSSLLDTPSPSISPSPSSPEPTEETALSLASGRSPLSTPSRLPKVYPSVSKPTQEFSRSARKRSSVQALGSIEFLQHHFTKVGIVSSSEAAADGKATTAKTQASPPPTHFLSTSFPHLTLQDLPPSPARPDGQPIGPTFPPQEDIRTDPELLRPKVVRSLKAVERVFEIGGDDGREVDILEMLKTTIGAVRSVRNYVVALPDEAFPPSPLPSPPPSSPSSSLLGLPSTPHRPQSSAASLRPQQGFSTPSRPSQLSRPTQQRIPSSSGGSSASPSTTSSPVARIRKAALDVLGSLRLVEEQYRLPDDDSQSPGPRSRTSASQHDDSQPSSPSRSSSSRHLSPLRENATLSSISPSPSSESASLNLGWGFLASPDEKRTSWEDSLGTNYQSGVTFESSDALKRERTVLEGYLSLVDELLFEGPGSGAGSRGWDKDVKKKRGGRKSSLGPADTLGEPDGGEQEVEGRQEEAGWLDESKDTATRLHSLLAHFLPSHLSRHLPPLGTSSEPLSSALEAYTNGQLLCHATNIAIRKSRRPWGFIPEHEIFDVLAGREGTESSTGKASAEGLVIEGTGQKEYVFRNVQNLRVWAATIKLRYLLPIVPPPLATSASPLPPQAIIFDPSLVAKREPRWEEMFEPVIKCWINRVVEEEREEAARDEE